ncbi:MAG: type ISP restriction/modification enzyme [Pseudomonadota bacterium]
MDPVETFFSELHRIHATGGGTSETSYYPPMANLLNELGKKLSPKVHCLSQLANTGAGSPDYGIFTQDQIQLGEPRPGQQPSRGVLELKGPVADLDVIVATKQVQGYLVKHGFLLVGNLREFRLLQRDPAGVVRTLETCTLAAHADGLWQLCAQPRKAAKIHGERFGEFLRRAMLYRAPLVAPKDLAWFLASYAREARIRIESAVLNALAGIRTALEDALGIRFQDQRGEHFFRSTFVQTLFYGVFSAWVLWDRQTGRGDPAARFDWRLAAHYLHVPLLRALFHQMAAPGPLNSLHLTEVLEWTQDALNRVDRPAFFAAFDDGEAVQYFYEPFLEAFDPQLRKDLGVWYTPREIVQYMVARVDAVLREELGIADGLAGEEVYILDPCCGTGAYLVEVIKTIARTMRERGADALWADDLKQAALKRVIGFEILTAPFVVAHLQLGLLLQHLGAPLAEGESERVGVYLTNALTGWEPPTGPKAKLPFPEFEAERDAADEVKREQPILVVLGNPPYNAFAGVSPAEEQGMVDVYKEGLNKPEKQGGWGIKKFNLDDLYVRFFRLAEKRIAEKTGKGVVSFISNFSYLSDPSFVVMRKRFLDNFDKLWFDCLNGDSRETGKLTPEGMPDPSVFSTDYNHAGIQVGTAISILVRKNVRSVDRPIYFRHFWGVNKRSNLLGCIDGCQQDFKYEQASPTRSNRFSYRPERVPVEYKNWPKIIELAGHEPFNGPIERRGNSFIVFENQKENLELLKYYLDPELSNDEVRAVAPSLMKSSGEYKAEKTRAMLKGKVSYSEKMVVRYPYKPFDVRLCYLDASIQPLFSRPSPELLEQAFAGNQFIVLRETGVKDPTSPPLLFSSLICDYHSLVVEAKHIPFYLTSNNNEPNTKQLGLGYSPTEKKRVRRENISKLAEKYLDTVCFGCLEGNLDRSSIVWFHGLAICYSPDYLMCNADGLRLDWPRIPLPDNKAQLLASADLGRRLAALLDQEQPVPGVTSDDIRPEQRHLAVVSRVGGGQLDRDAGHLALTAGWGHAGKGGVTMPGSGRASERDYLADELVAITAGAAALGLDQAQTLDLLGPTCLDVYLNGEAYWRCVPAKVWAYTIGGYQVLKKWLSYREQKLLGRDLRPDEARYFGEVARRIAAILLLGPELDANYQAVKSHAYPWPGPGQAKA